MKITSPAPLRFMTTTMRLTTKPGLIAEIKEEVPVGLHESNRYLFHPGFQNEFDTATYETPKKAYRLFEGLQGMTVNDLPVSNLDFNGFSLEAEEGIRSRDECANLDVKLRSFISDKQIPVWLETTFVGPITGERIEKLMSAYYGTLAWFSLTPEHDWAELMPDPPVNYFSFPLAMQHSVNLFQMAFNTFRMKQLIYLMERAYRGNSPDRCSQLNAIIRRNMADRLKHSPFNSENNSFSVLEQLDLSLRVALLKEIMAKRTKDRTQINMIDWERLDLFLLGQSYLSASSFFWDKSVFKEIVRFRAFHFEIYGIFAQLAEKGAQFGNPGVLVDMKATRSYLAYHGAQIIKAYEKITGRPMGLPELVDLPVPFDLFTKIDERYTPST